jgi:hypothetical protein
VILDVKAESENELRQKWGSVLYASTRRHRDLPFSQGDVVVGRIHRKGVELTLAFEVIFWLDIQWQIQFLLHYGGSFGTQMGFPRTISWMPPT